MCTKRPPRQRAIRNDMECIFFETEITWCHKLCKGFGHFWKILIKFGYFSLNLYFMNHQMRTFILKIIDTSQHHKTDL